MPTTWTERSVDAGGFQEGRPENNGALTDYYIDVLFEGTGFFGLIPTTHTERSAASASFTERSAPATVFTERSA